MSTAISFVVTLVLLSVANCTLTHISGSSESLQQYGMAESTQSFLLQLNDGEYLTETSLQTVYNQVITSHQMQSQQVSDTTVNISVTLFFDGLPGEALYTVEAIVKSQDGTTYRNVAEQMHSVYGLAYVRYEDNQIKILSGDNGKELNVSASKHTESEPITLQSISYAPQGVDVEATAHVLARTRVPVLASDDVNMVNGALEINIHARYLGSAVVLIESRNLVLDGESFETALVVNVLE